MFFGIILDLSILGAGTQICQQKVKRKEWDFSTIQINSFIEGNIKMESKMAMESSSYSQVILKSQMITWLMRANGKMENLMVLANILMKKGPSILVTL